MASPSLLLSSMGDLFSRRWKAYSQHDPKMQATAGSTTTTSPLAGRARLPRQIQRALPVYVVLIFLVLLLSNLDSVGSTVKISKRRRNAGHAHAHPLAPLGTTGKFPRKIWQTWKVDALDFEERDLTTARTWTTKNPGHRYEVLTDNNDLYYVESHFGPDALDRPDIVDMYRALTAKIVKADILRYLIMYVEGGVYADIDVEDLKPVERWIPDRYREEDVDLVISVEIDEPEFKDHPVLGRKSQSFCQWTFLSRPGLPLMLRLVEHIMDWLTELAAAQKVAIADLTLDFDDVISGTGPSAFTAAVLAHMSAQTGAPVTWAAFHNLAESKLVGGVLVLTVEAFAAGQGHSDSGNHNARTALVKHHYHASLWPQHHPRYSHPIYGEVERCNWDPECVRLWDANKASFDLLSPEDKAVRLALAEADAQRLALMPPEPPAVVVQPDQQAMLPAVVPAVPAVAPVAVAPAHAGKADEKADRKAKEKEKGSAKADEKIPDEEEEEAEVDENLKENPDEKHGKAKESSDEKAKENADEKATATEKGVENLDEDPSGDGEDEWSEKPREKEKLDEKEKKSGFDDAGEKGGDGPDERVGEGGEERAGDKPAVAAAAADAAGGGGGGVVDGQF